MADSRFMIRETAAAGAASYTPPRWLDMGLENAEQAAPAIYAQATSETLATGLWRTKRPVIDYSICNRCWWLCSTYCPEGAIRVDEEGHPHIDYVHCKGCLVCMTQCPTHAIQAQAEEEASRIAGEER